MYTGKPLPLSCQKRIQVIRLFFCKQEQKITTQLFRLVGINFLFQTIALKTTASTEKENGHILPFWKEIWANNLECIVRCGPV